MTDCQYPMYLISLKVDQSRRQQLSARFPSHYESMELVEAVDGRELKAKEYYEHVAIPTAEGHRLMVPGEVGCSLSHIKALSAFLESGAPAAMVLEDDVIGEDTDLQAIADTIPGLPEKGLLICGGQEGLPARKYVLGKSTTTPGLFRLPPYSNRNVSRACSYVVTRFSAQRILACHQQSLKLADAWEQFFNDSDISIYYLHRLSHPQDLSSSHLEKERGELFTKQNKARNKLIHRVRRINRKLGALRCWLAGYRRVVP